MWNSLSHRRKSIRIKNGYHRNWQKEVINKILNGNITEKELLDYNKDVLDDIKFLKVVSAYKGSFIIRMLSLGIIESDIRCLEWLNDYIVNVVNSCMLSDGKIDYEKSLLGTKKYLNNRMSDLVAETSTLLVMIAICGVTFLTSLFISSLSFVNVIFGAFSLALGYYYSDKLIGLHPVEEVGSLELLLAKINASYDSVVTRRTFSSSGVKVVTRSLNHSYIRGPRKADLKWISPSKEEQKVIRKRIRRRQRELC